MRPILNRLSYHRLKKNINFADISLIHSNAISIDFGAYLYKKTGIPHIWHVRDFLIFEKKWNSIIWNLPSYMRKYSSKIITVSDSLKDHLISCDCKISSIQTIYDGIEIPKEENNNVPIQNKKILSVACVGYICELKGQEVLIDAISLLPNEKKSLFRFFFWGEFDNRIKTRIMHKIHENKLESTISFCGFCANVFSELEKMDIGIQPSHSEGFSRATAEYMAAGLCVIAAKEGAITELIQNQENGFLYEDYNAKELAHLLLYCYDNQDVMTNYAKKAKEKALKKYNIDKNFTSITNIYKELLQLST